MSFVEKLRGEKRFSGIEELKAQIGRDVEEARGCSGRSRGVC
nr:riboflavin kinase [Rubrobacter marinus]